MARMASSGRGALPKLVWTTIPVALITRRRESSPLAATSAGRAASRREVQSARVRPFACPRNASLRYTSRSRRMAPTTTARGWLARRKRISFRVNREATEGIWRTPSGAGIPGDYPLASSRRRIFFP